MEVQRLLAVLFAVLSSTTSAEMFPVGPSIRSWSDSVTRSIPGWTARRLHAPVLLHHRTTNVQASVKTKRRHADTGFYYGINESIIRSRPRSLSRPKKESLNSLMSDALSELKGMRQEMEALRKEMQAMKRRFSSGDGDFQEVEDIGDSVAGRRKKQREFDKIGLDVEQWAENILFKQGEEEDGWKEVPCNKLVRNKYNPQGNTRCFMKWMTDSRGEWADPNDDKEYPCIKVFATIDAPIDEVCAYLAEENRVSEYNDLVIQHRDVEEITPHSKVVWGICPQILFINPRDFVTFCHHRWLHDGTQVVVNQAVEHKDVPAINDDKSGKVCRGHALRGANFIMKHPDDPNKTQYAMVAHANPGGDIPQWACKTAVNAMAPIEPFKLFHKINDNVKQASPHLLLKRTEMVGSVSGRSGKPAGLSQMGYACFWPDGGGLREGLIHPPHPDHMEASADEERMHDRE